MKASFCSPTPCLAAGQVRGVRGALYALCLARRRLIPTRLIFRLSLVKTAYTKAQFQHMVAQAPFGNVDTSRKWTASLRFY